MDKCFAAYKEVILRYNQAYIKELYEFKNLTIKIILGKHLQWDKEQLLGIMIAL